MDVVWYVEPWAAAHEQEWHKEAMQTFGERVLIRQAWQFTDFENGLVTRCTQCAAGGDASVQSRISSVYKQAGDSFCNNCYGIGFEGGFMPTIYVMHVLALSVPERRNRSRSGEEFEDDPEVQFLWYPKLRDGDLMVRVYEWAADNQTPLREEARYRLNAVKEESVRTGPRGIYDREDYVVAQTAQVIKIPEGDPFQRVPFS